MRRGPRLALLVLGTTVAALLTHLVVSAIGGPLDVPAGPGSSETVTLPVRNSMVVGALAAGAALVLASLLLPRVARTIRVTRAVGMVVLVLSMAPILLTAGDLSNPLGLVVLHLVVGGVVLAGLPWALGPPTAIDG